MTKTLSSLDGLADTQIDVVAEVLDNVVNRAAEEAVLKEKENLKKRINQLEVEKVWLQQLFEFNGGLEFLNGLKRIMLDCDDLKKTLDEKSMFDTHYPKKMACMQNMLASVNDVIDKMLVASSNNTLETQTALQQSIQQLETNTKQLEHSVEKSTFTRVVGSLSYLVGVASLLYGALTFNLLLVGLGLLNMCMGASLLSDSKQELQAAQVGENAKKVTSSLFNFFKPAATQPRTDPGMQATSAPVTRASDNSAPQEESLYPRLGLGYSK